MIFLNSRYAEQPVSTLVFLDDTRVYRTALRRPPSLPPASARVHYWTSTDRLDLLASQYYGDPTLGWRIADLNPEILDFATVAPGTPIRVSRV